MKNSAELALIMFFFSAGCLWMWWRAPKTKSIQVGLFLLKQRENRILFDFLRWLNLVFSAAFFLFALCLLFKS